MYHYQRSQSIRWPWVSKKQGYVLELPLAAGNTRLDSLTPCSEPSIESLFLSPQFAPWTRTESLTPLTTIILLYYDHSVKTSFGRFRLSVLFRSTFSPLSSTSPSYLCSLRQLYTFPSQLLSGAPGQNGRHDRRTDAGQDYCGQARS